MVGVVSILCLVYMGLVMSGIVFKLLRTNRKGRYTVLKNYNKGKFALLYLTALPLYLVCYIEEGTQLFAAVLSAFRDAVKCVVLDFNYSLVESLAEQSSLFGITVFCCFLLTTLNTVLFLVLLFFQQIMQFFYFCRLRYGKKTVLFLVGFHEQTPLLLKQIDRKKMSVAILAPITPLLSETAYIYKCAYFPLSPTDSLSETAEKVCRFTNKRAVRMIIHTGEEITNLVYATDMAEIAAKRGLQIRSLRDRGGVRVFVFGSEKTASAYTRLSELSGGCVQFLDPNERVAQSFVDRFPLTCLLRSGDIDTATATVSPATDIHMLFVGFGKTNRRLLQTYICNNQVQTLTADGPAEKAVEYYVYDIKETQNEKNLNHNCFRYREWLRTADAQACLALPQNPFDITFRKEDVNHATFYQMIRQDLAKGENGRNGIVVSLGSDLENLDIAQKIHDKLVEWNLERDATVFVHIRDEKVAHRIVEKQCADKIICFGIETSDLYHPERILREQIELMARRRHISHTAEKFPNKSFDEVCQTALQKWCTEWTQVQRESNLYACLSLRLRLQLMGYDYVPQQSAEPDAGKDFLRDYQKDDAIPYSDVEVDGRKTVDYSSIDYKQKTVRAVLARTEHQRWNAYMFSNGYVPATKEEILTLSRERMFRLRKHANLTTFEGLIEYRKMMVTSTCTESQADVIRYDYQLMDDAQWLLQKSGYKIIKKDGRK